MTAARHDKHAVVPDAEPATYYDRPVIKEPVWTWEVPAYFFTGGLAGASSALACAARVSGHSRLAATCEQVAAGGALASPVLLVMDLGRPSRFYNMLRVAKPTSPMNVGSWLLGVYAPAAVGAAVLNAVGWAPTLQRVAGAVAALTGPGLATYTAVLVATTAVPVWSDASRELPFLFAGSALAAAGGAATALLPPVDAGPARRALLAGNALEAVVAELMVRRLDPVVARPYHQGRSGGLMRAAKALTLAGSALTLGWGGRRRPAAVAGGILTVAGSVCERYAVVEAGKASARDPQATITPQRRRAD